MASGDNIGSDFADVFVAAVAVGLFITALFISFFAVPAGLVLFVGYKAWKNHYNSPAQRERRAREHLQELYRETLRIVPKFPDKEEFGSEIYRRLPPLPDEVENVLLEVALDLYDAEHFGEDVPPPPAICDGLEGQQYKDLLSNYAAKAHHPHSAKIATETITKVLLQFTGNLPPMQEKAIVTFPVPLTSMMDHVGLGLCVGDVIYPFFDSDEMETAYVFRALKKQLRANLDEVSGNDGTRPATLLPPHEYEEDDVVERYLRGTPLIKLFSVRVPFGIPEQPWFEGAWMLAPPGTGKTQTLQYLISEQLDRVARDECSIVVIDGKGDLLEHLPRLQEFGEGGKLEGRLLLIEPDVQHPLALNPFDLGRIDAPDPQRKEELRNSTLSLLGYVFQSLMGDGSDMTAMQSTLYRPAIRLLMEIEGATLDTFLDILKPGGEERYREEIERLEPRTRRFFEEQWNAKQFRSRKEEIAWRIHTLFQTTPLLASMFSAPESKFSLYDELGSGKVICINTSKRILGEQGCEIFGRFFISMLLAASHRRSMLPRAERLPVFAYIDECHDYIKNDENVASILDQARSMNIGLVLAHQRTSQIESPNVLDALATTAIKFAHTDNHRDATFMARAMNTKPEFITDQPEGHFALSVRNLTHGPMSVRVPFFVMEGMDKMTDAAFEQIRTRMHERYCDAPRDPPRHDPPPRPPENDGPGDIDDLHHADTDPS